jgi:ligand-binding sensor protein
MVTTIPLATNEIPKADKTPLQRRVNRLGGIVQRLARSEMFKEYERAFSDATELPVALRPLQAWNLSMAGKARENRFCALMAQCNRACASCLEIQERIAEQGAARTTTVTCFAGLSDTAIPVRVGEGVVGYLQTGQVSLKKPSAAQFELIAKQLMEWGANLDLREVKEAYFDSRTLSSTQYSAMVNLLENFA